MSSITIIFLILGGIGFLLLFVFLPTLARLSQKIKDLEALSQKMKDLEAKVSLLESSLSRSDKEISNPEFTEYMRKKLRDLLQNPIRPIKPFDIDDSYKSEGRSSSSI